MSSGHPLAPGPMGARFAFLRDLDTRDLGTGEYFPFGVLLERPDGTARLHTFDRTPADMGLRADYESFERALEVNQRNVLITAIGEEGQAPDDA